METIVENQVFVTSVTPKATGVKAVVHKSKENDEIGFIVLKMIKPQIVNTRTLQFQKLFKYTCQLYGEIEWLKSRYKDGDLLNGVIVRNYSFNPFYPNQKPVINPETGVSLLKDGKEYYQFDKYFEDATDPEAVDKWVENDEFETFEEPLEIIDENDSKGAKTQKSKTEQDVIT